MQNGKHTDNDPAEYVASPFIWAISAEAANSSLMQKRKKRETMEDFKAMISERLGVPAVLLTGESAEEDLAQAKAILAYKREQEQTRPKSHAEQFKEWFNASQGIEEPDETAAAFKEIEDAIGINSGAYPSLSDGGEVQNVGDCRTPQEQFKDWFYDVSAYNPRKGEVTRTQVI